MITSSLCLRYHQKVGSAEVSVSKGGVGPAWDMAEPAGARDLMNQAECTGTIGSLRNWPHSFPSLLGGCQPRNCQPNCPDEDFTQHRCLFGQHWKMGGSALLPGLMPSLSSVASPGSRCGCDTLVTGANLLSCDPLFSLCRAFLSLPFMGLVMALALPGDPGLSP